MTTHVDAPADLLGLVGADLGATGWVPLDPDHAALFASTAVTGDTSGSHGAAPPYLLLSLVNQFLPELIVVDHMSMGVNVGLEQVRFPAPVVAGSSIRGRGEVLSVAEAGGGVQAVVRVTIEVAGPDDSTRTEPACIADTVSRFFA